MDNATAEYTFITAFFTLEASLPSHESDSSLLSPTALLSPTGGSFAGRSNVGSEYGGDVRKQRTDSITSMSAIALATTAKEEQAASDAIWHQVLDPVLEYCQVNLLSRHPLRQLDEEIMADFCSLGVRSYAFYSSSPHNDASDGRHCRRGAKTQLPTAGILCFWYPVTDVARVPKGND